MKKNTTQSAPKIPEKNKPVKLQSVDKPTTAALLVTIDEITERWNDFLIEIKRHNQSVASALRIGQPTGIAKSGEVVIAFQHRFHRERINESKIKLLVERVLSDLIGKQLYIQTVIDASIASTNAVAVPEQDDLQAIVQNFSGQIIK